MTNIYFCDVCNESVPQADLDLGRALVVKGRVICSICDRAMTQRAEARAQTRPANFGLDLDASGGAPAAAGAIAGNGGLTAATVTETTPGAAPLHGAHAHPHHVHREPRGAGVGLAFATGVVALGGLAVLWQWTRDELSTRDEQSARAAQMSVVEQDTARRGLERLAADLERRVQAADERVTTALDSARASGDAARSEQHAQLEAVRAQIGALDRRVAEFGEQVAIVARHDQELMTLQQRLTALSAELTALSGALTRLGESANLARAGGAPMPPEPAAAEQPAWFELTHLLESPSTADRWQGLIALGETRDIACAPYVAPLLSDKDIFIRMAAARVLGDLGAPAGVEPLIEALADSESAVREASLDALKRITKRNFEFDPQGPEAERAKRVKQWREWWAKEREKFGA